MIKMETGLCRPTSQLSVAVVMCLLTLGCSTAREPENEKPVVPVTGVVHVNGAPAPGVEIKFHSKVQEESHRVFPKAKTDAEGKFVAWTYRQDDGLPPGDYSMTFIYHGKLPPFTRASDAPDLLQGKYSDPENTEQTVTVPENSEPIDLGTIELTI